MLWFSCLLSGSCYWSNLWFYYPASVREEVFWGQVQKGECMHRDVTRLFFFWDPMGTQRWAEMMKTWACTVEGPNLRRAETHRSKLIRDLETRKRKWKEPRQWPMSNLSQNGRRAQGSWAVPWILLRPLVCSFFMIGTNCFVEKKECTQCRRLPAGSGEGLFLLKKKIY